MLGAGVMSQITRKTLQHIATLARLDLDDAVCDRYVGQCTTILEFVEQLSAVDTSRVEPMAHAGAHGTAWREDEVLPSGQADAIVENAPAREGRFFNVPKVIG